MATIDLKAADDAAPSQEYQVKAAFLYNFLQFVDWPDEKLAETDESLTIGIIGKNPFGNAFEPIKDKKVKNKAVVIKHFESFEKLKSSAEKDNREIETLKKCNLLFICSSEQQNLKEIIATVKDHNVLTVGEMNGFLDAGGIINWFVEDKKIRFDINATAARESNLKIRSNLLRLAKRVIGEDVANNK
jgi:hypothetical protein